MGPCPPEYIAHTIQRDIWHCTPSEFRAQRLGDYFAAVKIISTENRIKARQQKLKKK